MARFQKKSGMKLRKQSWSRKDEVSRIMLIHARVMGEKEMDWKKKDMVYVLTVAGLASSSLLGYCANNRT